MIDNKTMKKTYQKPRMRRIHSDEEILDAIILGKHLLERTAESMEKEGKY